jgi:transcriptional regulator with XRE-family HTH domain
MNLTSIRIKECRIDAKLTQQELADKLGLKKSVIAKYEDGSIENIKKSTVLEMARIFGCTPSYLMAWDTPKIGSKLTQGKRVAILRETQRLTVEDFARKAELKTQDIVDIESNKLPLTFRVARKFTNAYRVSTEWLLIGVGEMFLPTKRVLLQETLEDLYECNKEDVETVADFLELSSDDKKILQGLIKRIKKTNDSGTKKPTPEC